MSYNISIARMGLAKQVYSVVEYCNVMIQTKKKLKLITKSRIHEKDTGSSQVQISILTARIAELADHLKKFRKDNHSRRGLLKMVAKRKSLLEYLAKGDTKELAILQRRFGIKK